MVGGRISTSGRPSAKVRMAEFCALTVKFNNVDRRRLIEVISVRFPLLFSLFLLSFLNQIAGSKLLPAYDLLGNWQNLFEISLPAELIKCSARQCGGFDHAKWHCLCVRSMGSNQMWSSEVDFVSQAILNKLFFSTPVLVV